MAFPKASLCALTLICLVLAACQPAPQSAQKAASQADLSQINTLRDQFAAAYNAGDASAVARLYTDDAIMLPAHQPAVEGRQAIQASLQTTFQSHTAKMVITPLETQVFGDWAYDRGAFSVTVTPKAGGKPVEDAGKYLVMLKRLPDGSWRVHRHIDNSNNPLPKPPAAKKGKKKK